MIAGSIAAALAAVLALLLRRASLEESVWKASLVAMLLAPLFAFLPKIDVGVSVPWLTSTEVVTVDGLAFVLLPQVPRMLIRVWAVIALLVAARTVLPLLLMDLIRPRVRVPLVAGVLRPRIVLPHDSDAWSADLRAAVFAHERAHLDRHDAQWNFLAAVVRALYWFHPAAYVAQRRLAVLSEQAADRGAVHVTGDRLAYAEHLLRMATVMSFVPAMARGSIEDRIDALLAARTPLRLPLLVHLMAGLSVIAIAALAAMAKQVVFIP